MDISFPDKSLRALCEKASLAEGKLGRKNKDLLHALLADIETAETISEIPWGKFLFDPSNSFEVCFVSSQGLTVILRCAHLRPPIIENQVDWTQVSRVALIKIEVSNG